MSAEKDKVEAEDAALKAHSKTRKAAFITTMCASILAADVR